MQQCTTIIQYGDPQTLSAFSMQRVFVRQNYLVSLSFQFVWNLPKHRFVSFTISWCGRFIFILFLTILTGEMHRPWLLFAIRSHFQLEETLHLRSEVAGFRLGLNLKWRKNKFDDRNKHIIHTQKRKKYSQNSHIHVRVHSSIYHWTLIFGIVIDDADEIKCRYFGCLHRNRIGNLCDEVHPIRGLNL